MHRLRIPNEPALTKSDAQAIRAVEQTEPEGTGHGLVPPVPFGSKVDALLSLAAER